MSRPVAEKLSDAELERVVGRVPTAERKARWRQVARGGFSKDEMDGAYDKMRLTFERMEQSFKDTPYLAGAVFSLADIAMVPFAERMMDLRPDLVGAETYPATHAWFERLRERPSFKTAFFFGNMDARTGAVASALGV